MQTKYTANKLNVILFSTDESKQLYDTRANALFQEYGGSDWPSILLPGGFAGALKFGDFGYGKVLVDEKGIVRAIKSRDLEASLKSIFGE